ncbi:hypothetical protein HDU98_008016 [Podochytrium sp. JEL0797]|nr:hypothetical protein HDU98_008016 [Podochytrium sp. JEL0797]
MIANDVIKSDGSCVNQIITANWGNAVTPQSISSLSVLFDTNTTNVPTNQLTFKKLDGSTIDVSSHLLCTRAHVNDGGNPVAWDICTLSDSSLVPDGTYDNTVGAQFTFNPTNEDGSEGCRMGIYEMKIYGIATPDQSTQGLSVGAVIGIILGVLAIIGIGALCFIRRANLRKGAARWLNQPSGGWESLELWANERA